jgi:hypothetical protein
VKSGSAGFGGKRGSNLCGILLCLLFSLKFRNAFAANLDAYMVAPRLIVDPSSFARASCSLSSASRNVFSIFFFLYRRQAACMKHTLHVFHCGEYNLKKKNNIVEQV